VYAGWSGISCFFAHLIAFSKVGLSRSTVGSSRSACTSALLASNSWIHHSKTYAAGASGWLFSMNSPKLTRYSPRSRIFSTPFCSFSASSGSLIQRTSPFASLTVGPLIESTGTTPPAFPGRSVFNCVPVAMKSSTMCIVAGWTPAVANPWFRARPYRSRKAPAADGCPNTGRPAMRSRRYLFVASARGELAGSNPESLWSSLSIPSSVSLSFVSLFVLTISASPFLTLLLLCSSDPMVSSIRSCSHGHSTSASCRVYRWILGALSAIPSASTRHIPPRAAFVSTRSRSRYPETSSLPVASPSSMIGICLVINFVSLSFGEYCNPVSRSYRLTSSAYLSVSSVRAEYSSISNSDRA